MEELISIRDGQRVLHFSYEDLLKYHGGEMAGGVALAFRILQIGLPLVSEDIPQRGHFRFYNGIGPNAKGLIDAVEMVLRVKTYGTLSSDQSYCSEMPGQLAPNGGRYYFELTYGERTVHLM